MLIKNKNRNQTPWTIRFSRSPPVFSQAQSVFPCAAHSLSPAGPSLSLSSSPLLPSGGRRVGERSKQCLRVVSGKTEKKNKRKKGGAGWANSNGPHKGNGLGRAERKRVGCAGKALFKSFRAETAPSHLHSAKDHP
jgi:hypothetical protein